MAIRPEFIICDQCKESEGKIKCIACNMDICEDCFNDMGLCQNEFTLDNEYLFYEGDDESQILCQKCSVNISKKVNDKSIKKFIADNKIKELFREFLIAKARDK